MPIATARGLLVVSGFIVTFVAWVVIVVSMIGIARNRLPEDERVARRGWLANNLWDPTLLTARGRVFWRRTLIAMATSLTVWAVLWFSK